MSHDFGTIRRCQRSILIKCIGRTFNFSFHFWFQRLDWTIRVSLTLFQNFDMTSSPILPSYLRFFKWSTKKSSDHVSCLFKFYKHCQQLSQNIQICDVLICDSWSWTFANMSANVWLVAKLMDFMKFWCWKSKQLRNEFANAVDISD